MMFEQRIVQARLPRRNLLAAAAMATLAACAVVPKGPAPTTAPAPRPAPSGSQLPSDSQRHRIALLVPMNGVNGAVGQSIANAATMAVMDTNAQNLRITNYDTSAGAASAASRAIADGNQLILGPLLADDIPAVAGVARAAKVPIISFSNDADAAGRDVYVMGSLPGESIRRTVRYARGRGVTSFAALVPKGDYGERASAALIAETRAAGGSLTAMESYDRSAASITAAASKLRGRGAVDAILIADSGSLSARAAGVLKPRGAASPRLLGTELWSGEKALSTSPSLEGAWFAAVSDTRFPQFVKSYRTRFGAAPYRIATLGYDAVLLTLRVARDWKPGRMFPTTSLTSPDGFLGLDGAFRFDRSGVINRAFEVREVSGGAVKVVSPAPTKFGN
ncbi:ABC-type branched-subunit amino acid transport system substrate-binding protein [Novosphingobium fluoreni]|uniref:ABC-type branched-subunit amino acid transport system substrate-binding protein n=1 Tax=Novosphingobium fluoreni TaxID=1391222 RepID=A0A7W6C089_9SPHN|nr:ABC-type branched-subunit amino acid transport system substrate-binding protein [Novosphingobium fluoreni]